MNQTAKSIFRSKTFWAAIFTGISALTPIVVRDIKAGKIPVEDAGAIVLVVCGVGGTVVGRVQATESVYTPDGLPGHSKADF